MKTKPNQLLTALDILASTYQLAVQGTLSPIKYGSMMEVVRRFGSAMIFIYLIRFSPSFRITR